MDVCPCGSGMPYAQCCGVYIDEGVPAPTAEALMRSRYTAHALCKIPYVVETVLPSQRGRHKEARIRKWSQTTKWLELKVEKTEKGGPADETGVVVFTAYYDDNGRRAEHHEEAAFKKVEGRWYFDDGEGEPPPTIHRDGARVKGNDPCPCGSGKKHKKCCGR